MSPSSVAFETAKGEKPCRVPSRRMAAADAHAPSVALPMRFMLTGMMSLAAGCTWLVAQPDLLATYHYNQYVIAVTHLFVLGWISSVILGAMYQLVPVALETRLHSERLARWHFVLHTAGFVGMVLMFRVWNMKQVGHFGSLLAVGVGFFVYNLARTLARVPRWNVVAWGIVAALCWLSLTILAGLYLAAAKCWSFSPFNPMSQMHAHAHLGGLGVFVMMIVTVSFKLVPMFCLSELQSARRAGWSLALLNTGLAGAVATILLSSAWKLLFAVVIVAGLTVYLVEIAAILRARKRRRFDWGLRYFLTALALLIPTAALGLILAWPGLPATVLTTQLENVYGLVAFVGVISLGILGMLYKIVPFLVWYASYSRFLGQERVPALADLYSPVLQAAGYWLFLSALAILGVATALGGPTAVGLGAAVLLASVTVYLVNMVKILAHLIWPHTGPLVLKPASPQNA